MNKHVIINDGLINNGQPVQTEYGRIDVYRYSDLVLYSNPPPESYEIGFDCDTITKNVTIDPPVSKT